MNRIFVVVALIALFSSIGSAITRPDAKRVAAIMSAAKHRMSDQDDAWFDDGEFPIVVQNLRILSKLAPDDYDIATSLGWMLENVDEYPEALAVYREFRTSNRKLMGAADPEANFYFRQKQYAKVPDILEHVIPTYADPNTYRILAHSYEKLGKYDDAERVWKAYLTRAPWDETAKHNLRSVMAKLAAKNPR